MTEELPIRRLDSSAVDAIHALWRRTGLPFKPRGRDTPERLGRAIDRGTEVFFGIFSEDALIGVILVTHDGRKGWLNRVAIDPNHRGGGLAKRLIRHAEAFLHGEGVEIVAALVEEWNKESLNLFRRCGYVLHEDIYYLSKRDHPEV